MEAGESHKSSLQATSAHDDITQDGCLSLACECGGETFSASYIISVRCDADGRQCRNCVEVKTTFMYVTVCLTDDHTEDEQDFDCFCVDCAIYELQNTKERLERTMRDRKQTNREM